MAEAAKQREEIQAKILKLNKEREAYLAAERKKQARHEGGHAGSGDLQGDPGPGRPQNFKFE